MTEDNATFAVAVQQNRTRPISKVARKMTMPHIPMVVWSKTMLPIAMAAWPKTMSGIAVAAWKITMPGNAMTVRQKTTLHIVVAVRRKIRWLLHCLPLHRPFVLLLCHPLAVLAGCCVALV